MIEASRFVTFEVVSRPQTPWGIECAHYVDDPLPHTPLLPCSYWGYGQVFITYIIYIYIATSYLCICLLLWKYSSPCRTSLSMVAMTVSSRTPPFAPLATISLIMSNSEPKHSRVYNSTRCHLALHAVNIGALSCIVDAIIPANLVCVLLALPSLLHPSIVYCAHGHCRHLIWLHNMYNTC